MEKITPNQKLDQRPKRPRISPESNEYFQRILDDCAEFLLTPSVELPERIKTDLENQLNQLNINNTAIVIPVSGLSPAEVTALKQRVLDKTRVILSPFESYTDKDLVHRIVYFTANRDSFENDNETIRLEYNGKYHLIISQNLNDILINEDIKKIDNAIKLSEEIIINFKCLQEYNTELENAIKSESTREIAPLGKRRRDIHEDIENIQCVIRDALTNEIVGIDDLNLIEVLLVQIQTASETI
ncbi:MAG: hypothetical protein VW397_08030 [Candidatus Margulisiibacteriota bacterium]